MTMGLLPILFIVLLVLKLASVITISWFFVLAPLIVQFLIFFIYMVVGAIAAVKAENAKNLYNK